jgi:hypothetical protein
MTQHLVLATATKNTLADMNPFIQSFRQSSTADLAIICDFKSSVPRDLRRLGIIPLSHSTASAVRCQIHNSRYFKYLDYLYEIGPSKYSHVFLTDLRDVFFQGDIFDFSSEYLTCYLEEDGVSIGAERFNALWIKNLFGASVLDELAAFPVSCCGTVLGPYSLVLRYLEQIADFQYASRLEKLGEFSYTPHDQGIHNYIIRKTSLVEYVRFAKNGESGVATLGYVNQKDIDYDSVSQIYSLRESIPHVIHQYDRIESIRDEINLRYGLSI